MSVEYLSMTIAGEATLLGLPGMLAVAATLAARMVADMPIETAYYGLQQPNQTSDILAYYLSVNPELIRTWFGDSRYFYYALSGEDKAKLGFPKAPWSYKNTFESVHLYSRWRQ